MIAKANGEIKAEVLKAKQQGMMISLEEESLTETLSE